MSDEIKKVGHPLEPTRRFFVFNYVGYMSKEEPIIHGEVFIQSSVFPSSNTIISHIRKLPGEPVIDITITGRFEFKNEADYKSHQYY